MVIWVKTVYVQPYNFVLEAVVQGQNAGFAELKVA
jgi:hypothetical protein